jgi:hypothetical protein
MTRCTEARFSTEHISVEDVRPRPGRRSVDLRYKLLAVVVAAGMSAAVCAMPAGANQADPTSFTCDGYGELIGHVTDYPGGNSVHLASSNPTGAHNFQIKATYDSSGVLLAGSKGWLKNHASRMTRCTFVGAAGNTYTMYGQFN